MPMVHLSRQNNYCFMLALVVVALLLAVALPSAALAMSHDADPPPVPITDTPPPPPPPSTGDGTGPPPVPGNGGTTTPPPVPGNGGTTTPPPVPGNGGTTTPPPVPDPGDDMMMTTRAALSPNSIVSHAATPAQLVKSGDGMQYYFIGADGTASSGPVFPSFSDLAEMYPSGDWVPLLSAPNPYTGKHVNVDYIPNEQSIRVSTFYPDNEYDTNKPYVFTVDADHSVTHNAW